MHLSRDASSQVFERDDWSGLRWRQRILMKSTHTWKPDKKLGARKMIFIMFSDNITSLIRTKTAVAEVHKLVSFRVATTHH